MEVFGGFMVMFSILGFFLAILWFILPFVIFAMKGKLDRAAELLENVDRRLAAIEKRLAQPEAITTVNLPPEEEPAAAPPSGPSHQSDIG